MLQGTGTAGRSFKRRPWLRMGCCANDDADGDSIDNCDIYFYCVYIQKGKRVPQTNIYESLQHL
jgi:hypothetical protein